MATSCDKLHATEWRVYRKDDGHKWIARRRDITLQGDSEEDLRGNLRKHCIDAVAMQEGEPVDAFVARLKRTWTVKVAAKEHTFDEDEDDFTIGISLFD